MTAPFQGPRAPFGGRPGSGGDSTLTFTTVAAMDANVPTVRTVAVNLAPMFGPAGGRFVFNVVIGKWVPETTVRIYGTGVGTVYTAAAGDINTNVQVGLLDIPASLVMPGVALEAYITADRADSGTSGAVTARILYGAAVSAEITGIVLGAQGNASTFARVQANGDLVRAGTFSSATGYGTRAKLVYSPSSGIYSFAAALNTPTVSTVQSLTSIFATLTYGGT